MPTDFIRVDFAETATQSMASREAQDVTAALGGSEAVRVNQEYQVATQVPLPQHNPARQQRLDTMEEDAEQQLCTNTTNQLQGCSVHASDRGTSGEVRRRGLAVAMNTTMSNVILTVRRTVLSGPLSPPSISISAFASAIGLSVNELTVATPSNLTIWLDVTVDESSVDTSQLEQIRSQVASEFHLPANALSVTVVRTVESAQTPGLRNNEEQSGTHQLVAVLGSVGGLLLLVAVVCAVMRRLGSSLPRSACHPRAAVG